MMEGWQRSECKGKMVVEVGLQRKEGKKGKGGGGTQWGKEEDKEEKKIKN